MADAADAKAVERVLLLHVPQDPDEAHFRQRCTRCGMVLELVQSVEAYLRRTAAPPPDAEPETCLIHGYVQPCPLHVSGGVTIEEIPDPTGGVETVVSTVAGIPATEQNRGVAVDPSPAVNVLTDDDPEFWPGGRVRGCPEIQRSDLGGVPHVAHCWLHDDHKGESCRFSMPYPASDAPPRTTFSYGVISYRLRVAEKALVKAGWTRDEHGREWLPPARRADRAALLTEDEMRAMDLSCELANLIKRIIGDGPQAEGDNAERCAMIHAIQRTIMSQAAARAYPDKYRLLGGRR